jgi:uncharacterized repeat protein (TIGR01451 family)
MKQTTLKFLLFLTIFSSVAFAQKPDFKWAKVYTNSLSLSLSGVAIDNATSSIYTTGSFEGVVDFDPGPGVYNVTAWSGLVNDIFITKSDSGGNLLWAKIITGADEKNGSNISVDRFGNIFISGTFTGTIDTNPGAGISNLSSPGGMISSFVVKLDPQGNFLWSKTTANRVYAYGTQINSDSLGNAYVVGQFSDSCDFDPGSGICILHATAFVGGTSDMDWFISKFSPSGNFIWAKRLGGSPEESIGGISIGQSGNIFLTGYYKNTVDFDTDTSVYNLTALDVADLFIEKLDASGNMVWVKSMGGSSTEKGNGLVLDEYENMYITGLSSGFTDFDPGPAVFNPPMYGAFVAKYDSSGGLLWAKKMTGVGIAMGIAIARDRDGIIYSTGSFENTKDFDPGMDTFNLTSYGTDDAYLSILDPAGNFMWAGHSGGVSYDRSHKLLIDNVGNAYFGGFFNGTADLNPDTGVFNYTETGSGVFFLCKMAHPNITGYVYFDGDQNCQRAYNENGVGGVYHIIQPGNLIVQTDSTGRWALDSLPDGVYNISIDTINTQWDLTCASTQSFTVTNHIARFTGFGLVPDTTTCPAPDISVSMPFMRWCFSNQPIVVYARNHSTSSTVFENAFVQVELDSLLSLDNTSLPYTPLGNNTYEFQLGDLNPGQSSTFVISTTVDCAGMIGQTLRIKARLFPTDSCIYDTVPAPMLPNAVSLCTLPWDHSHLVVTGHCINDTIQFSVINTGQSMQCYSSVRVFVDGTLTYTDSIQLSASQTYIYSYPGDGHTWVIQVDQHSLHPGNSHPTAFVEACGNTVNWTPGLVNDLPMDDADPDVDIYCGVVSASFDPNDKTGLPVGLGAQHEILPNQQLQYTIRFQNTGTDTAFNIVVRDTLDTDLNIFTVISGAASHAYSFRMYGPRVLEWTFSNILLPDSTTNEPDSHGFFTYTVEQNPNLQNGSVITNHADIYFDFNAPVQTNQTVHVINDQLNNAPVGMVQLAKEKKPAFSIYPNPAADLVTVLIGKGVPATEYRIVDQLGQVVMTGLITGEKTVIDIGNLADGFYILNATDNSYGVKLIKQ